MKILHKSWSFEDSSYKKMKELGKIESIYSPSSLEVRMSILATCFFLLLFPSISKYGYDFSVIKNMVGFLDNVGIALLGFLGVIIAGLAISITLISNKVFNFVNKNNKLDVIESLLYGYYLLGLITAGLILAVCMIHMISYISVEGFSVFQLNILFLFRELIGGVISYFLVFSIFYAVKLIGVGLQLFEIINTIENRLK